MFSTRRIILASKNIYHQNHHTLNKILVQKDYNKLYLGRLLATNSKNSDENRIYYGSLTPRMKAVKIFSITTSVTGLAVQPILMEQGIKIGGTGMAIFLCGFAGFFTFVTPLLLHIVTRNYVTEMHYDSKTGEYTATTLSILLQKKQTKFKPNDVKVPDVPGMFSSIVVGKTSLFIDPSQFTDTEHYVKIMGYDKPIDFKLELDEKELFKESEKENESLKNRKRN